MDSTPFGSGSTSAGLGRTGWTRLVLALVLLGFVAYAVNSTVEGALMDQLRGQLRTIRDADVAALRQWLDRQRVVAKSLASNPEFSKDIALHVRLSEGQTDPAVLGNTPPLKRLREALGRIGQNVGYDQFVISDVSGRAIGALHDDYLGTHSIARGSGVHERVLAGEPTVSPPFLDDHYPGEDDHSQHDTMVAAAPVLDGKGKAVAVLNLTLDPSEFTHILSVARMGESGETYAFDARGLLLSHSRFAEKLRELELIPAESEAILRLELRDPGLDLTCDFGGHTVPPRQGQPLTAAVASAVSGEEGVNVRGYRDYRGVEVVGAWTWLPDYRLGIVTEIDAVEAFRPLNVLRACIWSLFALLVLSIVGALVSLRLFERARRRMGRAQERALQLGQYTLQQKIGAGGMGEVYMASHAMLRRPTAIKLLRPDLDGDSTALKRFEREVQLTAQLTHPNTIMIYDYGRTPEGVFYYAMEYLEGVPLDEFVEKEGPLSPGRVIYILRQVCASLDEAHSMGLIHRDIKPANIMLCQRGGSYDVAKVLDFGLVKQTQNTEDAVKLSAANSITGTPLYMSPEAISDPDSVSPQSDLYSVGALGYFLLTGKTVFEAKTAVALLMNHVKTQPKTPTQRMGKPINEELERVLMQCLEKEPSKRPKDAYQLSVFLRDCEVAEEWDSCAARGWWRHHLERLKAEHEGLTRPCEACTEKPLPVSLETREAVAAGGE